MLLFSQYSDILVLYVFHFPYKENVCLFHCWIICKCVFNFAISRPDVFWTIKTRPHHSCKLLKSLIVPHNCHIFLQATYWDRFLWRPSLGSSQCLCAPGAKNLAWFLSDALQTNVHWRAQWRFTTTTKTVWKKRQKKNNIFFFFFRLVWHFLRGVPRQDMTQWSGSACHCHIYSVAKKNE